MTRIVILATLGSLLLLLSYTWPALDASQENSTLSHQTLAERGRQLFAGKGCIGCDWHADLMSDQAMTFRNDGPPDLTAYAGSPAFLREWLRDPAAVRPGTEMPNLGLSEAELDALVAFLLAEE